MVTLAVSGPESARGGCAGQPCSGAGETRSVTAVSPVLWAGEVTWGRVRSAEEAMNNACFMALF